MKVYTWKYIMNHSTTHKKGGASNNQAEMQGRYSKHQIDRVRSRAGSGSQWSSWVTSTSSVSSNIDSQIKHGKRRNRGDWNSEDLQSRPSHCQNTQNTSLTDLPSLCHSAEDDFSCVASQVFCSSQWKSWLARTCPKCLESYEKKESVKMSDTRCDVATAQQPHNPTLCRASFHKSSKNFQQVSGFVMDVPLHPRGWGGWLWDLAQMLCSSSTLGFA